MSTNAEIGKKLKDELPIKDVNITVNGRISNEIIINQEIQTKRLEIRPNIFLTPVKSPCT